MFAAVAMYWNNRDSNDAGFASDINRCWRDRHNSAVIARSVDQSQRTVSALPRSPAKRSQKEREQTRSTISKKASVRCAYAPLTRKTSRHSAISMPHAKNPWPRRSPLRRLRPAVQPAAHQTPPPLSQRPEYDDILLNNYAPDEEQAEQQQPAARREPRVDDLPHEHEAPQGRNRHSTPSRPLCSRRRK